MPINRLEELKKLDLQQELARLICGFTQFSSVDELTDAFTFFEKSLEDQIAELEAIKKHADPKNTTKLSEINSLLDSRHMMYERLKTQFQPEISNIVGTDLSSKDLQLTDIRRIRNKFKEQFKDTTLGDGAVITQEQLFKVLDLKTPAAALPEKPKIGPVEISHYASETVIDMDLSLLKVKDEILKAREIFTAIRNYCRHPETGETQARMQPLFQLINRAHLFSGPRMVLLTYRQQRKIINHAILVAHQTGHDHVTFPAYLDFNGERLTVLPQYRRIQAGETRVAPEFITLSITDAKAHLEEINLDIIKVEEKLIRIKNRYNKAKNDFIRNGQNVFPPEFGQKYPHLVDSQDGKLFRKAFVDLVGEIIVREMSIDILDFKRRYSKLLYLNLESQPSYANAHALTALFYPEKALLENIKLDQDTAKSGKYAYIETIEYFVNSKNDRPGTKIIDPTTKNEIKNSDLNKLDAQKDHLLSEVSVSQDDGSYFLIKREVLRNADKPYYVFEDTVEYHVERKGDGHVGGEYTNPETGEIIPINEYTQGQATGDFQQIEFIDEKNAYKITKKVWRIAPTHLHIIDRANLWSQRTVQAPIEADVRLAFYEKRLKHFAKWFRAIDTAKVSSNNSNKFTLSFQEDGSQSFDLAKNDALRNFSMAYAEVKQVMHFYGKDEHQAHFKKILGENVSHFFDFKTADNPLANYIFECMQLNRNLPIDDIKLIEGSIRSEKNKLSSQCSRLINDFDGQKLAIEVISRVYSLDDVSAICDPDQFEKDIIQRLRKYHDGFMFYKNAQALNSKENLYQKMLRIDVNKTEHLKNHQEIKSLVTHAKKIEELKKHYKKAANVEGFHKQLNALHVQYQKLLNQYKIAGDLTEVNPRTKKTSGRIPSGNVSTIDSTEFPITKSEQNNLKKFLEEVFEVNDKQQRAVIGQSTKLSERYTDFKSRINVNSPQYETRLVQQQAMAMTPILKTGGSSKGSSYGPNLPGSRSKKMRSGHNLATKRYVNNRLRHINVEFVEACRDLESAALHAYTLYLQKNNLSRPKPTHKSSYIRHNPNTTTKKTGAPSPTKQKFLTTQEKFAQKMTAVLDSLLAKRNQLSDQNAFQAAVNELLNLKLPEIINDDEAKEINEKRALLADLNQKIFTQLLSVLDVAPDFMGHFEKEVFSDKDMFKNWKKLYPKEMQEKIEKTILPHLKEYHENTAELEKLRTEIDKMDIFSQNRGEKERQFHDLNTKRENAAQAYRNASSELHLNMAKDFLEATFMKDGHKYIEGKYGQLLAGKFSSFSVAMTGLNQDMHSYQQLRVERKDLVTLYNKQFHFEPYFEQDDELISILHGQEAEKIKKGEIQIEETSSGVHQITAEEIRAQEIRNHPDIDELTKTQIELEKRYFEFLKKAYDKQGKKPYETIDIADQLNKLTELYLKVTQQEEGKSFTDITDADLNVISQEVGQARMRHEVDLICRNYEGIDIEKVYQNILGETSEVTVKYRSHYTHMQNILLAFLNTDVNYRETNKILQDVINFPQNMPRIGMSSESYVFFSDDDQLDEKKKKFNLSKNEEKQFKKDHGADKLKGYIRAHELQKEILDHIHSVCQTYANGFQDTKAGFEEAKKQTLEKINRLYEFEDFPNLIDAEVEGELVKINNLSDVDKQIAQNFQGEPNVQNAQTILREAIRDELVSKIKVFGRLIPQSEYKAASDLLDQKIQTEIRLSEILGVRNYAHEDLYSLILNVTCDGLYPISDYQNFLNDIRNGFGEDQKFKEFEQSFKALLSAREQLLKKQVHLIIKQKHNNNFFYIFYSDLLFKGQLDDYDYVDNELRQKANKLQSTYHAYNASHSEQGKQEYKAAMSDLKNYGTAIIQNYKLNGLNYVELQEKVGKKIAKKFFAAETCSLLRERNAFDVFTIEHQIYELLKENNISEKISLIVSEDQTKALYKFAKTIHKEYFYCKNILSFIDQTNDINHLHFAPDSELATFYNTELVECKVTHGAVDKATFRKHISDKCANFEHVYNGFQKFVVAQGEKWEKFTQNVKDASGLDTAFANLEEVQYQDLNTLENTYEKSYKSLRKDINNKRQELDIAKQNYGNCYNEIIIKATNLMEKGKINKLSHLFSLPEAYSNLFNIQTTELSFKEFNNLTVHMLLDIHNDEKAKDLIKAFDLSDNTLYNDYLEARQKYISAYQAYNSLREELAIKDAEIKHQYALTRIKNAVGFHNAVDKDMHFEKIERTHQGYENTLKEKSQTLESKLQKFKSDLEIAAKQNAQKDSCSIEVAKLKLHFAISHVPTEVLENKRFSTLLIGLEGLSKQYIDIKNLSDEIGYLKKSAVQHKQSHTELQKYLELAEKKRKALIKKIEGIWENKPKTELIKNHPQLRQLIRAHKNFEKIYFQFLEAAAKKEDCGNEIRDKFISQSEYLSKLYVEVAGLEEGSQFLDISDHDLKLIQEEISRYHLNQEMAIIAETYNLDGVDVSQLYENSLATKEPVQVYRALYQHRQNIIVNVLKTTNTNLQANELLNNNSALKQVIDGTHPKLKGKIKGNPQKNVLAGTEYFSDGINFHAGFLEEEKSKQFVEARLNQIPNLEAHKNQWVALLGKKLLKQYYDYTDEVKKGLEYSQQMTSIYKNDLPKAQIDVAAQKTSMGSLVEFHLIEANLKDKLLTQLKNEITLDENAPKDSVEFIGELQKNNDFTSLTDELATIVEERIANIVEFSNQRISEAERNLVTQSHSVKLNQMDLQRYSQNFQQYSDTYKAVAFNLFPAIDSEFLNQVKAALNDDKKFDEFKKRYQELYNQRKQELTLFGHICLKQKKFMNFALMLNESFKLTDENIEFDVKDAKLNELINKFIQVSRSSLGPVEDPVKFQQDVLNAAENLNNYANQRMYDFINGETPYAGLVDFYGDKIAKKILEEKVLVNIGNDRTIGVLSSEMKMNSLMNEYSITNKSNLILDANLLESYRESIFDYYKSIQEAKYLLPIYERATSIHSLVSVGEHSFNDFAKKLIADFYNQEGEKTVESFVKFLRQQIAVMESYFETEYHNLIDQNSPEWKRYLSQVRIVEGQYPTVALLTEYDDLDQIKEIYSPVASEYARQKVLSQNAISIKDNFKSKVRGCVRDINSHFDGFIETTFDVEIQLNDNYVANHGLSEVSYNLKNNKAFADYLILYSLNESSKTLENIFNNLENEITDSGKKQFYNGTIKAYKTNLYKLIYSSQAIDDEKFSKNAVVAERLKRFIDFHSGNRNKSALRNIENEIADTKKELSQAQQSVTSLESDYSGLFEAAADEVKNKFNFSTLDEAKTALHFILNYVPHEAMDSGSLKDLTIRSETIHGAKNKVLFLTGKIGDLEASHAEINQYFEDKKAKRPNKFGDTLNKKDQTVVGEDPNKNLHISMIENSMPNAHSELDFDKIGYVLNDLNHLSQGLSIRLFGCEAIREVFGNSIGPIKSSDFISYFLTYRQPLRGVAENDFLYAQLIAVESNYKKSLNEHLNNIGHLLSDKELLNYKIYLQKFIRAKAKNDLAHITNSSLQVTCLFSPIMTSLFNKSATPNNFPEGYSNLIENYFRGYYARRTKFGKCLQDRQFDDAKIEFDEIQKLFLQWNKEFEELGKQHLKYGAKLTDEKPFTEEGEKILKERYGDEALDNFRVVKNCEISNRYFASQHIKQANALLAYEKSIGLDTSFLGSISTGSCNLKQITLDTLDKAKEAYKEYKLVEKSVELSNSPHDFYPENSDIAEKYNFVQFEVANKGQGEVINYLNKVKTYWEKYADCVDQESDSWKEFDQNFQKESGLSETRTSLIGLDEKALTSHKDKLKNSISNKKAEIEKLKEGWDNEINDLRENIKEVVNKLDNLELTAMLEGFKTKDDFYESNNTLSVFYSHMTGNLSKVTPKEFIYYCILGNRLNKKTFEYYLEKKANAPADLTSEAVIEKAYSYAEDYLKKNAALREKHSEIKRKERIVASQEANINYIEALLRIEKGKDKQAKIKNIEKLTFEKYIQDCQDSLSDAEGKLSSSKNNFTQNVYTSVLYDKVMHPLSQRIDGERRAQYIALSMKFAGELPITEDASINSLIDHYIVDLERQELVHQWNEHKNSLEVRRASFQKWKSDLTKEIEAEELQQEPKPVPDKKAPTLPEKSEQQRLFDEYNEHQKIYQRKNELDNLDDWNDQQLLEAEAIEEKVSSDEFKAKDKDLHNRVNRTFGQKFNALLEYTRAYQSEYNAFESSKRKFDDFIQSKGYVKKSPGTEDRKMLDPMLEDIEKQAKSLREKRKFIASCGLDMSQYKSPSAQQSNTGKGKYCLFNDSDEKKKTPKASTKPQSDIKDNGKAQVTDSGTPKKSNGGNPGLVTGVGLWLPNPNVTVYSIAKQTFDIASIKLHLLSTHATNKLFEQKDKVWAASKHVAKSSVNVMKKSGGFMVKSAGLAGGVGLTLTDGVVMLNNAYKDFAKGNYWSGLGWVGGFIAMEAAFEPAVWETAAAWTSRVKFISRSFLIGGRIVQRVTPFMIPYVILYAGENGQAAKEVLMDVGSSVDSSLSNIKPLEKILDKKKIAKYRRKLQEIIDNPKSSKLEKWTAKRSIEFIDTVNNPYDTLKKTPVGVFYTDYASPVAAAMIDYPLYAFNQTAVASNNLFMALGYMNEYPNEHDDNRFIKYRFQKTYEEKEKLSKLFKEISSEGVDHYYDLDTRRDIKMVSEQREFHTFNKIMANMRSFDELVYTMDGKLDLVPTNRGPFYANILKDHCNVVVSYDVKTQKFKVIMPLREQYQPKDKINLKTNQFDYSEKRTELDLKNLHQGELLAYMAENPQFNFLFDRGQKHEAEFGISHRKGQSGVIARYRSAEEVIKERASGLERLSGYYTSNALRYYANNVRAESQKMDRLYERMRLLKQDEDSPLEIDKNYTLVQVDPNLGIVPIMVRHAKAYIRDVKPQELRIIKEHRERITLMVHVPASEMREEYKYPKEFVKKTYTVYDITGSIVEGLDHIDPMQLAAFYHENRDKKHLLEATDAHKLALGLGIVSFRVREELGLSDARPMVLEKFRSERQEHLDQVYFMIPIANKNNLTSIMVINRYGQEMMRAKTMQALNQELSRIVPNSPQAFKSMGLNQHTQKIAKANGVKTFTQYLAEGENLKNSRFVMLHNHAPMIKWDQVHLKFSPALGFHQLKLQSYLFDMKPKRNKEMAYSLKMYGQGKYELWCHLGDYSLHNILPFNSLNEVSQYLKHHLKQETSIRVNLGAYSKQGSFKRVFSLVEDMKKLPEVTYLNKTFAYHIDDDGNTVWDLYNYPSNDGLKIELDANIHSGQELLLDIMDKADEYYKKHPVKKPGVRYNSNVIDLSHPSMRYEADFIYSKK